MNDLRIWVIIIHVDVCFNQESYSNQNSYSNSNTFNIRKTCILSTTLNKNRKKYSFVECLQNAQPPVILIFSYVLPFMYFFKLQHCNKSKKFFCFRDYYRNTSLSPYSSVLEMLKPPWKHCQISTDIWKNFPI